jgi:putative sigma-54 modulation protein
MTVNIRTKNVEMTEKLRTYADKKFSRLDRYLPHIIDLHLDLAQERHRNGGDRAVAQVTLRDRRGAILRAEDKSQGDVFAAIDLVVDKLYRQISRYKDKRRRRTGDKFETLEPELALAEAIPDIDDSPEEEETIIARRKQINVMPMNELEAIDQMDLLGHDFFLFFNADAGRVNVVYRRKDGGYGLLDPLIT